MRDRETLANCEFLNLSGLTIVKRIGGFNGRMLFNELQTQSSNWLHDFFDVETDFIIIAMCSLNYISCMAYFGSSCAKLGIKMASKFDKHAIYLLFEVVVSS